VEQFDKPESPRDVPFWSRRRRRIISLAILVFVFAGVWAIKWGGLRDPGVIAWEPGRWALGWAPSFLAAFDLPFIWLLVGRRALGRPTRVVFLPECVVAVMMLWLGEFLDLWLPQVGHTAAQTFAVSDLAAAVGGAAVAFLFYSASFVRKS